MFRHYTMTMESASEREENFKEIEMNKYIEEAIEAFNHSLEDLKGYTAANTFFMLTVNFEAYPMRFVFEPSEDAMQESLFEPDEDGAIGEIVVTCSSGGTGVDLGIKCHMQAEIFKKLLSKCTNVSEAYLHAYKAQMSEARHG